MPQIRNLLRHVSVETAEKPRRCDHDGKRHAIAPSQLFLRVGAPDGQGPKNYCVTCGMRMLHQTAEKLAELSGRLGL